MGGNAAALQIDEQLVWTFDEIMARDYKHSHRSTDRTPSSQGSGILIGLLLGLMVAAGVYVYDRRALTERATPETAKTVEAPPTQPAVKPKPEVPQPPAEPSLEFYNRLRTLEVVIPENEREVNRLTTPKKGEKARVYMLQAGSFHKFADADRVRAKLALQGIEASIQKVTIDSDVWHRVRIGPISDPDELVRTREKLRASNIDSLVLLLGG